MNRNQFCIVGAVVWIAVAGFLGWSGIGLGSGSIGRLRNAVVVATINPSTAVNAIDPTGRLRVGDPIFAADDEVQWKQVGFVRSVQDRTASGTSAHRVVLAWHGGDDPLRMSFVGHQRTGRLDEVIATLLPESKRDQIQQRVALLLERHGEEIAAAMMPLVQESLAKSVPIIESGFRESIARHRGDIDQLAERFNDEIIRERMIPLARKELLPIVRLHAQPPIESIGRELWNRASLWRFGWRAAYDKSPLPKQDLLQEEWDRFIEQEAVPVFEAHTDELVKSMQQVILDLSANQRIRSELAEVVSELATDEPTQQLVRQILREALIENQALRDVWRDVWTSPQARQALDFAADRLEPLVRQIGDDLFGSRQAGINPDFARVLRNQILGKDRRWIIASPMESKAENLADDNISDEPVIEPAGDRMPYPLVYLAGGAEQETPR